MTGERPHLRYRIGYWIGAVAVLTVTAAAIGLVLGFSRMWTVGTLCWAAALGLTISALDLDKPNPDNE